MKCCTLTLLSVVLLPITALAYYPIQCNSEHAESDYLDCEAIVVARCIKLERKLTTIPGDKKKSAFYIATLKVGRVIKGELKTDEEFEMGDGVVFNIGDDNETPTYVAQCNTHPRAGFSTDGVYLLFINRQRAEKNTWTPRSCHFSIHELTILIDEKTDSRTTGVRESNGSGQFKEPKAAVPLEKFLARKKIDAENARKRSVEKNDTNKK